MDNRMVALSVLEDLAHCPLPPQPFGRSPLARQRNSDSKRTNKNKTKNKRAQRQDDGNNNANDDDTSSSSSDDDDDDDDDDDGSDAMASVEACDEAAARRATRCQAVLQLPLLCRKLGTRWTQLEVVPYLLRCIEENDATLSLAVGVAVLGLVAPQQQQQAQQQQQQQGQGHTTSTSYLSVDALQPVLVALCASRDERVRAFVAEVVLPHVYFGFALQPLSLLCERWDVAYAPTRVLWDEACRHEADVLTRTTTTTTSYATRTSIDDDNDDDDDDDDDDVEDTQQQQQRHGRVTRHDATSARLHEALRFCTDVSYACLDLPHATRATHQTDADTRRAGMPYNNNSSSSSVSSSSVTPLYHTSCSSEGNYRDGSGLHTRLRRDYARRHARHGNSSNNSNDTDATLSSSSVGALLQHAQLHVYGASYAQDVYDMVECNDTHNNNNNNNDNDLDSASCVAYEATVRQCMRAWCRAVSGNARACASTYGSDDALHTALAQRWRALCSLLQTLLTSDVAGAVGVATHVIALVLHALDCYRVECADDVDNNNNDDDARQRATDAAAAAAACAAHNATALRWRYHAAALRHVARVVIAACTATTRTATAAAAQHAQHRALVHAQQTLRALLFRHHLLSRHGDVSSLLLSCGRGPPALHAQRASVWDMSVTVYDNNEDNNDDDNNNHGHDDDSDSDKQHEGGTDDKDDDGNVTGWRVCLTRPRPPSLPRVVHTTLLRAMPLLLSYSAREDDDDDSDTNTSVTLEDAVWLLMTTLVSRTTAAAVLQLSTPPSLHRVDDTHKRRTNNNNNSHDDDDDDDVACEDDDGVVEAVLDAVQQLCARLAVALPAQPLRTLRPPLRPHRVHDDARVVTTHNNNNGNKCCSRNDVVVYDDWLRVSGQLHALLTACLCALRASAAWKVKWLLCARLPSLVAVQLYVAMRMTTATTTTTTRTAGRQQQQQGSSRDVHDSDAGMSACDAHVVRTTRLLIAALSPRVAVHHDDDNSKYDDNYNNSSDASATRWVTSALRACMHDEEAEVRAAAVTAAARVWSCVAQYMVRSRRRICCLTPTSTPPQQQQHASRSAVLQVVCVLGESACDVCRIAITDGDEAVCCAAIVALATLARTASALACHIRQRQQRQRQQQPSVYTTYDTRLVQLSSDARQLLHALVRNNNSNSTTMQLTLAAQLADLLVRGTCAAGDECGGAHNNNNDKTDDDVTYATTQQRVYADGAVLLQCLTTLAQHDTWRCRECYVHLLCDVCARCLRPWWRYAHAHARTTQQGDDDGDGQRQQHKQGSRACALCDHERMADVPRTRPAQQRAFARYRFALHELLPCVARALFDTVQHVRDAALHAATCLCAQLDDNNNDNEDGDGDGCCCRRSSSSDCFTRTLFWPRVQTCDAATRHTHRVRTTLLRVAVRLRTTREQRLQLLTAATRDAVDTVRLAAARALREWLLQSSSSLPRTRKHNSSSGHYSAAAMLRPGASDEASCDAQVLSLVRALLQDASADVRDEAAKALQLCA